MGSFSFTMRETRGFSLMEAMTVIGIMTIILVMITEIFNVSNVVFVTQSARSRNETGVILASRAIADAARGALSVEASRTINGTLYTTSSATLVLRIPTVTDAGTVTTASYDYVAIYRHATETDEIWSDTEPAVGSRLVAGKKRLTEDNARATFRYNDASPEDASRVQVYLMNQRTARDTTVTASAWTALFLRNH